MQTVLISDHGPIRTLTLNRPHRRNALTLEMMQELIAALEGAAAAPAVRVLVLAGAGEAFCAGLDVDALRQMSELASAGSAPAKELSADAFAFAHILRALYEMPIPTIAAVHGHAVAGGCGIATVCDFTLAVPEAKFGYTEVRIGFVPALVSAYLALQVGEKRSRDLLLTGRLFSATEAHAMGLVTELVAADALEGRVESLAATLLANSPGSLRATKALLAEQNRVWLDAAIELALSSSAGIRQTAEFREGLTAFLEKRRPAWTKTSLGG